MTAPVVALAGLAGAGKSTVAAALSAAGYSRVRFAGPIKAMLTVLGLSPEELDGPEKNLPNPLLGGRTPRHAMQTLGTEWGRDLIHPRLWIDQWTDAAMAVLSLGGGVVADDCRFPDEAAAVRALGGVVWRVERPSRGAGDPHRSECAMDAVSVDRVLINNGSLEQLAGSVARLLEED